MRIACFKLETNSGTSFDNMCCSHNQSLQLTNDWALFDNIVYPDLIEQSEYANIFMVGLVHSCFKKSYLAHCALGAYALLLYGKASSSVRIDF